MSEQVSRDTNQLSTERDSLPYVPPGSWQIGAKRSEISFGVRHLGIHTVHGKFADFSGTIVVGEQPTQGSVNASVDLSSLDSGSAMRDRHLKSDMLLDVDSHPVASFESVSVGVENEGLGVDGLLRLYSRSHPIKFAVNVLSVNDTSLELTAQTTLSRRDVGLKLAVKPSLFDRGVADTVALHLRIVAHRDGQSSVGRTE